MIKKHKSAKKFRFKILLILSALIFIITFIAYMINTDLEDIVAEERGEDVISHNHSISSETEN